MISCLYTEVFVALSEKYVISKFHNRSRRWVSFMGMHAFTAVVLKVIFTAESATRRSNVVLMLYKYTAHAMCVRVLETVIFDRLCVTSLRSYISVKSGRTSRRSRSKATAQVSGRRARSAPPTTRQRASSPRKPATAPVSHPSIDSFQSLTALPPFNALRLSYLARTYSCTPKFVSAYFLAVLCTCTPPFLST